MFQAPLYWTSFPSLPRCPRHILGLPGVTSKSALASDRASLQHQVQTQVRSAPTLSPWCTPPPPPPARFNSTRRACQEAGDGRAQEASSPHPCPPGTTGSASSWGSREPGVFRRRLAPAPGRSFCHLRLLGCFIFHPGHLWPPGDLRQARREFSSSHRVGGLATGPWGMASSGLSPGFSGSPGSLVASAQQPRLWEGTGR